MRQRFERAMTLLEVMLAVTIFSLVTVAVFAMFRSALRSLRIFDRDSGVLQSARVSLNLIGADLRCAYYLPKGGYDQNFDERKKRVETELLNAEARGEPLLFNPDDPDSASLWEMLNEQGLSIDLYFRGENQERYDRLEFTRYYSAGLEPINTPWNLARISYAVENGNLMRTEDNVIESEFDYYGERIPRQPPPKELIARNVDFFGLEYGYFNEARWLRADHWDSAEAEFRNPFAGYEGLRVYVEYETWGRQNRGIPDDGLPAWVDVTLGVRDYKEAGKVRYFQTRIFMPASLETYRPLTEQEMDQILNPQIY